VAEAAWLEISLIVNGEMAEAVAEVMSRFIPAGIVIEKIDELNRKGEAEQAPRLLRVSGYLPVDNALDETRLHIEKALWHLGQIQPLPEPEYRHIQEANWMEAWKKNYHPIPVGENLVILPAWIENPESDRMPIKIEPGMAFGTGVHPTTQLSLQLLEDHIRPGETVFDIGCGSGILSIAARKLGATAVYGVDVDERAVEIAKENTVRNGIREGITFEIGSIQEIKDGAFPIKRARVVVANILAHILVKLFDQGITNLMTEDGVLLLSGILEENQSEILTALERHHLVVSKRIQITDWVAFSAIKP
jgi:ribosomal protein L11 methyltransferase